jgi:hypothetical protein
MYGNCGEKISATLPDDNRLNKIEDTADHSQTPSPDNETFFD